MSMQRVQEKDYSDGRTKQAFKDSTDINKILKKAQKVGGLAHAMKYDKAVYGEFTGVDLLGAYEQVERAWSIFNDLPSEVRNEFDNDAFKFAGYASDPNNIDRLQELIPAIAEPGAYFPNPIKRGGSGAGAATSPADNSVPNTEPKGDGGEAASAPEGASKSADSATASSPT